MTDAGPGTWRLWAQVYPVFLLAAAGIVLLERGHAVGVGALAVAAALGVRVMLRSRRGPTPPHGRGQREGQFGHRAGGRDSSPDTYAAAMPIDGEYEPSSWDWVREQVAEYEASGGERANTLLDTGLPIIVLTTRGNKSGKVRKMALMRVEHDGEYALVASQGGMPTNPSWYYNLIAEPTALVIQDGAEAVDYVAREVTGDEKAIWWERSAAVYPSYDEYQAATTRVIPVLVARRADA